MLTLVFVLKLLNIDDGWRVILHHCLHRPDVGADGQETLLFFLKGLRTHPLLVQEPNLESSAARRAMTEEGPKVGHADTWSPTSLKGLRVLFARLCKGLCRLIPDKHLN